MPRKDPEKQKQYMKQYWKKNKERHNKMKKERYHNNKEAYNQKRRQYYQQNRESELARIRIYQQSPTYIKSRRIKDWDYQGIIFHDMDLLHDIYEQTTHCDNCDVFLQGLGNDRKCLDHDHSITDDENVRNVLCSRCNLTRR
tara:strand:- start:1 stop:426 length:426 start_codon:yes stop_codon:yes gene_type:complete